MPLGASVFALLCELFWQSLQLCALPSRARPALRRDSAAPWHSALGDPGSCDGVSDEASAAPTRATHECCAFWGKGRPPNEQRFDVFLNALLSVKANRVSRAVLSQGERIRRGLQVIVCLGEPLPNHGDDTLRGGHIVPSLPGSPAIRWFRQCPFARRNPPAS